VSKKSEESLDEFLAAFLSIAGENSQAKGNDRNLVLKPLSGKGPVVVTDP
jgi:hypothetical protein